MSEHQGTKAKIKYPRSNHKTFSLGPHQVWKRTKPITPGEGHQTHIYVWIRSLLINGDITYDFFTSDWQGCVSGVSIDYIRGWIEDNSAIMIGEIDIWYLLNNINLLKLLIAGQLSSKRVSTSSCLLCQGMA